ncbi:MAG: hypothetical protein JWO88_2455 [Frankiales bacterium]|nr:hypothetical protein [Frankiales bacterium]
MAAPRRSRAGARYDPAEPVLDARPKTTSVAWPHPVDERLEALVDAAIAAGERTDRREVLAALVSTTELSGPKIAKRIKTYRRMPVGDVVPAGTSVLADGRVELPNRLPGRRPGRPARG